MENDNDKNKKKEEKVEEKKEEEDASTKDWGEARIETTPRPPRVLILL